MIIRLNEETLWSGGPYNPNNPDGPGLLEFEVTAGKKYKVLPL